MCSFDGAHLGINSDVLLSFPVRCRNVCGTFVERLLLYCFDITTVKHHVYSDKQNDHNVMLHDYNVMRHHYNVKRHHSTVKQHEYNGTWHDYILLYFQAA
jgi:hypothetical protein